MNQEERNQLSRNSQCIPNPDTRPGLLFFFPASIPGAGKSTLIGMTDAELHDMFAGVVQSWSKDADSEIQPRNFVVHEGDEKAQTQFWNFVKEKRLVDCSSVSIANINVLPSAWEKVGEISVATKGKTVAILPAGIFQTTRVIGARQPDGYHDDKIKHCYPFRLHYLAVCMAHVMERAACIHNEKLDLESPNTLMVVVRSFSFYRGITAETLADCLNHRLDSAGALGSLKHIEVPFFLRKDVPDLQSDLREVLLEALRAQVSVIVSCRCYTTHVEANWRNCSSM